MDSQLEKKLPSEYMGAKWMLSDIFNKNGKDNAAYLYAVEEVNDARNENNLLPLDHALKESFMKKAGIDYYHFETSELVNLRKLLTKCLKYGENDEYEEYKVPLVQKDVENLKTVVQSVKKHMDKYDIITAVERVNDKISKLSSAIPILERAQQGNKDLLKKWELEYHEKNETLKKYNKEIKQISDKMKALQKALEAIREAGERMNLAQTDLLKYGFISVKNPKRPNFKKIKINYEAIINNFPKIKMVYKLAFNEKQRFHFESGEVINMPGSSGLYVAVNANDRRSEAENKDYIKIINRYENELEEAVKRDSDSWLIEKGDNGSSDFYKDPRVLTSIKLAARIYVSKYIINMDTEVEKYKNYMDKAIKYNEKRLAAKLITPSEFKTANKKIRGDSKSIRTFAVMQHEFHPWWIIFNEILEKWECVDNPDAYYERFIKQVLSAKSIIDDLLESNELHTNKKKVSSLQELAMKYRLYETTDPSDSLCYLPELVFQATRYLFMKEEDVLERIYQS